MRDKAVWKVGVRMKDGFPPLSSRGEGAPSREAPFGVRKRGWIPAFAGKRVGEGAMVGMIFEGGGWVRDKAVWKVGVRMKDGFPPLSSRGEALRGE